MWPIEWHHCQCPWMTLKVTFVVWNFSNFHTSWNIARTCQQSASRGPSAIAKLLVKYRYRGLSERRVRYYRYITYIHIIRYFVWRTRRFELYADGCCRISLSSPGKQLGWFNDVSMDCSKNTSWRWDPLNNKSLRLFTFILWLPYCVACPQYSIGLEALRYLCTSCLLPAFDEA